MFSEQIGNTQNGKTNVLTDISPAYNKISPVNFGPLTTMYFDSPKFIFSEDHSLALKFPEFFLSCTYCAGWPHFGLCWKFPV